MKRDRMRKIVAVLAIASMVLLAAGALGGVLVADGAEDARAPMTSSAGPSGDG